MMEVFCSASKALAWRTLIPAASPEPAGRAPAGLEATATRDNGGVWLEMTKVYGDSETLD